MVINLPTLNGKVTISVSRILCVPKVYLGGAICAISFPLNFIINMAIPKSSKK